MFATDFPNSLAVFKTRFHEVLAKMLNADELGAFILVLANSLQDKILQTQLSVPLNKKYLQIKSKFDKGELQATKDDYDVFSALVTLGLDNLFVWQTRKLQQWTLVYNPMRALRPARSSAECIKTLNRSFNPDAFHFNKSFLEPEIFWQGVINGIELRIFYNKFPFIAYHLLIVPDFKQCLNQLITKQYHYFIWNFVMQYQQGLTGLGIAYNSLGAYASINQLHFHGFIEKKLLPIEDNCWVHNGGDTIYPVKCRKLNNPAEAWATIQQLHQIPQAYNLLYRTGCCYVVTRKFQGEEVLPKWMQGMTWCEISGVQTLGCKKQFNILDQSEITEVLSVNRV
jgi:hypothetical protein